LWPNDYMDQDGTWYGGRPQPRRLCVRWGPSLLPKKGAEPPIFGPYLLWPNGCMDHDVSWYGGRPGPRRHCVRWGPSSPSPKRGQSTPPQVLAHVYCGQTAWWIKMALGMQVGLGPGHIVQDGKPAPQKGGRVPQFSADSYCGQTAGCIKMPLGVEVGLSPGDFMLDGDAAPTQKRGGDPQFSAHVYCGQTAAWIKKPLGTEIGLGPYPCMNATTRDWGLWIKKCKNRFWGLVSGGEQKFGSQSQIKQVVKVIWHKTASPPQTDGSVVFARRRQYALPCGHSGATWWIWLNLCFLWPTGVDNPNSKSIGSAISAQLTAESSYTLQWATLS